LHSKFAFHGWNWAGIKLLLACFHVLGHMSYLDNTQSRNVYQVGLLSRFLRMSGLISLCVVSKPESIYNTVLG
jgi:hypothetical protein